MDDFIDACRFGNLNVVLRTLNDPIYNKNILEIRNESGWTSGWTPLMISAWYGRHDILKVLLNAGANVNAKDSFGHNSLMNASYTGYSDCVYSLLEHGTDSNSQSIHGTTALFEAVQEGHVECIRSLLNAGADVNHKDTHHLRVYEIAVYYTYRKKVLNILHKSYIGVLLHSKIQFLNKDLLRHTWNFL